MSVVNPQNKNSDAYRLVELLEELDRLRRIAHRLLRTAQGQERARLEIAAGRIELARRDIQKEIPVRDVAAPRLELTEAEK